MCLGKKVWKSGTIHVIQGVPTSLEYAKCNVRKLRKVCERSELCFQRDRIKRGKLVIFLMYLGQNSKFSPFLSVQNLSGQTSHLLVRLKFEIHPFSGQKKFTPLVRVKIQNSLLFIRSKFKIHPLFIRSKLVGTPCLVNFTSLRTYG